MEKVETTKPNVIAISGIKNSGKTTLIAKIVAALASEGYKVGVIKHDGHEFAADHPGTDSHKIKMAGADAVMVYSATKLMLVRNLDETVAFEDLLKYYADMDLVIVEGMKHSSLPKIEVVSNHAKAICTANVIAIAAPASVATNAANTPIIDRNDVNAVLKYIRKFI